MKIRIVGVLSLIFLASGLQAQKFLKPHNQRLFNFGIKGGVLVNGLSTRIADYTNEHYVGFKGGFMTRFNIRKFYIQPELMYASTGGNLRFPDNAYYAVRLHTLELPVLVGYRFVNLGVFGMRVNAGPYASWHFLKSAGFSDPNYPQNNDYSGKDLRDYSIGFMAGLGIDIWKINLDFRYQWGFTNLLAQRKLVQDPGAQFKNGIWEFSVSYKIF